MDNSQKLPQQTRNLDREGEDQDKDIVTDVQHSQWQLNHTMEVQGNKAAEFLLSIPAAFGDRPLQVDGGTIVQPLLADRRGEGGEHRSCNADV